MRASAPRAFLPATLVLGLVAVVAIAATGSTRGGSDETRRPSDIVLDTFFTFALLALIPAAAILIYGLMQRKAIAHEVASGKYRRNSVLLSFLIMAAALAVAYYFRRRPLVLGNFEENDPILDPGLERPKPEQPDAGGAYEPELAWIPLLVVLALVAAGVGAYVVAKRRRERLFRAGPSQAGRRGRRRPGRLARRPACRAGRAPRRDRRRTRVSSARSPPPGSHAFARRPPRSTSVGSSESSRWTAGS